MPPASKLFDQACGKTLQCCAVTTPAHSGGNNDNNHVAHQDACNEFCQCLFRMYKVVGLGTSHDETSTQHGA